MAQGTLEATRTAVALDWVWLLFPEAVDLGYGGTRVSETPSLNGGHTLCIDRCTWASPWPKDDEATRTPAASGHSSWEESMLRQEAKGFLAEATSLAVRKLLALSRKPPRNEVLPWPRQRLSHP